MGTKESVDFTILNKDRGKIQGFIYEGISLEGSHTTKTALWSPDCESRFCLRHMIAERLEIILKLRGSKLRRTFRGCSGEIPTELEGPFRRG